MEMTGAAAISGDETLVNIVKGQLSDPDNPNYDMHRVTAASVYGCTPAEVTKAQRQGAKSVNFGALYGIGPAGLVATLRIMSGITVTEEEAQAMLEGFFKAYPGIKEWFKRSKRQLQSMHYIDHPYGRLRHISANPTGEEIRSATNFQIQGWMASVMKEALAGIDKQIKTIEDTHILTVIHDEIIVETPYEHVEKVFNIMYKIMNKPIKGRAKVPLTADPEIKFNLSKTAQSWTLDEFLKSGIAA